MSSVERVKGKLRLTDDAGRRWTVYDAIYRNYKPHRVRRGDPRANHRYFIDEDGTRKAITRSKQSRALDAETLAQQLAGSGFVGTGGFDPSTHGGR